MKKLVVALLIATLCLAAPAVAMDWDTLPLNMWVEINGNYPPGDLCDTYFDVYLDLDQSQMPEAVYPGWCVDTDTNSIKDTPYWACLSNTVGESDKWNMVNWIINNKGDATYGEIQAAIWMVMGETVPVKRSAWVNPVSEGLAAAAETNPEYMPACGDIKAVLVEVLCSEQNSISCCCPQECIVGQAAIIEVPMPECPVVPEFPTMMIPVFLVGSVLVAASVLKKE